MLLVVAWLTGCSNSPRSKSVEAKSGAHTHSVSTEPDALELPSQTSISSATYQWKLPKFTVQFKAGPITYDTEGRATPHSTYEVVYHESPKFKWSTVANSSLDIETFQSGSGFRIPEQTHLVLSDSGSSLLIQEDVPNDGSPCSNYILLQPTENGLAFSYLNLPRQTPKSPIQSNMGMLVYAPIYQWLPTVTSISDKTLHYQYPDGEKGVLKISQIPRSESPAFP